ncbi:MAG: glycosyltransferase family 2 protein [Clostridiales bacterium]|nr:glycosyltransferase family 2 protein [Clostridiales bacterium]
MNKLLTVIVPAYNVQSYIDRCLSTICDKQLEEELEVIVVNDGSTDNTQQIIELYRERFPEIIRIIKKINGGHGSAINIGIEHATGKYIKIIDADDFVNSYNFSILVEKLKDISTDIVITNYLKYYQFNNKIQRMSKLKDNLKYNTKYYFEEIYNKYFMRMHEILIKTEIIKKNYIKLEEKCFYVDQEYILYPIPYLQTILFLDLDIYYYRLGRQEQSMNLLKMREHVQEHQLVLKKLLGFYKCLVGNDIGYEYLYYIEQGIAYMLGSQIKIYLSFPISKQYKKVIKDLDQSILFQYPNIYYKTKNKYVWLLRISNYKIYYLGSFLLHLKEKIWRNRK